MPRSLRMDYQGAWQHVMNRGAAKVTIFQDDHDRTKFLEALDDACAFAALELHAYCLMGNHYHLLVKSREGRLSAGMQRLASNFTHSMNLRHGRDGALFRGRFASREIMDNSHLVQVLRYIHLNPMEARLVARPENWRWSSANAYVGVRPMGLTPRALVTAELLGLFGSRPRAVYADFIAAGIDENTRRTYDALKWT